MIVTIDGPTASGKSTLARMLAEELHFYFLSTGLLYRALAYILITKYTYDEGKIRNPHSDDIDEIVNYKKIIYTYDASDKERILFDHQDITPELKHSFIDTMSSILSTNAHVRMVLLNFQRAFAAQHDVVVEGRDTGSVVFPHADIKFFLTGSVEVRAQRWLIDQAKKGTSFSLSEAIRAITDRDTRDKEREIAPLRVPEQAVIIDSSALTRKQVLETMLKVIKDSKQQKKEEH